MPKAEAGSAKAVANAMKARGLTKLRFYCQVCSKPCRDANAYNNHINSEAHMRRIDALSSGGNPNKIIDSFSEEFQREFVRLLSRRFGTRRINANQVYQEYIADRHHLHMNATKWVTLSEFVKHLGREGIVQVEDTEQGWFISWIDNSPEALARQDALQKMNRAKADDEQRSRKLLQEQIARAEREKVESGHDSHPADAGPKVDEGLKRDGSAPLKIGISLSSLTSKKPALEEGASDAGTAGSSLDLATAEASSATISAPSAPVFKLGINPLKQANKAAASSPPSSSTATPSAASRPLGGNPLKALGSASSGSGQPPKKSKPPCSLTMAEKIMMEEMERKKRKAEAGRSVGPVMQQNVKRSRF